MLGGRSSTRPRLTTSPGGRGRLYALTASGNSFRKRRSACTRVGPRAPVQDGLIGSVVLAHGVEGVGRQEHAAGYWVVLESGNDDLADDEEPAEPGSGRVRERDAVAEVDAQLGQLFGAERDLLIVEWPRPARSVKPGSPCTSISRIPVRCGPHFTRARWTTPTSPT